MRYAPIALALLAACRPDADARNEDSGTTGTSAANTEVEPDSTGTSAASTSAASTSSAGTSEGVGSSTSEGDSTGEAVSYGVELSLVTDLNRAHPEMYGGWGPHLRGVMRDAGGILWFVADAGPDVLTNASILYFRRGEAGWEQVAEQAHLPGVQQNSASVLSGSVIRSYSVNTGTNTLEECYLDTNDLGYFACNTITIGGAYFTPPNSNYVGAALSPTGARVVWFTTVGGAGSGQFTYTYDFGGGWNGPVAWTLPGYNTFEYLRASFGAADTITWHGQLLLGAFPGGSFDPAIAEALLGQVPSLTPLGSGDPGIDVLTGADLWIDPETGDQHAIAQAAPLLAYYYRPGGASWAEHGEPLYWFSDTFRGRFIAPEGGGLALVRGSASGRSGVDVWIVEEVGGQAIDWDAAIVVEVPTEGVVGLGRPSGIYVEGATYQTEAVGGWEFALVGAYEESDHQVWHGSIVTR